MAMSTDRPDELSSEEFTMADRLADWLSDESTGETAGTGRSGPCASCGDPEGSNWLTLTVEWEDHLSEKHGIDPPEEACQVPLCTRCRSWAEMLEIAEMGLGEHAAAERQRILEERNRFLDSLQVELIANFNVSARLSLYE